MAFRGWPSEALEFYEGLEADNSKTYWTAHKSVYDDLVRAPMQALLDELEPEFGAGRIFRPYRDVRFSADKTPYKTSIAARLERRGYIHLSAAGLGAGSGMWQMERDQLARYRDAVDDDKTGGELVEIVAEAAARGIRIEGHDELKRVPRGFPADHPRADLLRYKGIVARKEWPVAPWLGTAAAKRRVVEFLRACAPFDQWLASYVGPSIPQAD